MILVPRYAAIIAGTILWDLGAVLQKQAVDRLPGTSLDVGSLLGSPRWLAGLGVTAAGWGLFVFGLQAVGVGAARAVTGGSYVVLALFSILFLRSRLSFGEWAAVIVVTVGILALGATEPAAAGPVGAPALPRLLLAVGCVAAAAAALLLLRRWPLAAFAASAGLLSSVGDLMVKLVTRGPGLPVLAGAAAALVAFYLAGFYLLSRAYKAGTMVAAVVISDFTARLGAVVLGAAVLGEPVAEAGPAGALRAAAFFLVLGGSVLLGRFGTSTLRARP
jgi:drug/metabolite transporter (DMT)-like permease